MRMDLDFTGRHVFVFGGTTGINFGIAQAFARCGAHVSVASRKRENVDAALARLADMAREEGLKGRAQGFCADVRDFDGLKAVLPKGAQVARASSERSFGVAQEVFANTIKTNEAIGALAKGQFEQATAQAQAEVEKVTKAAKAK